MIDAHKLCPHGRCTGQPPLMGCGTLCDLCFDQREHLRYTADAICGFPDKNPKNFKKTPRQAMRESEEGLDIQVEENRLRAQAMREILASTSDLDRRLAAGERGIPKIPDAPDTRHAAAPAPPYDHLNYQLKLLIDSHREMLATLEALSKQVPNANLNWDFIGRVISRGHSATK